MSRTDSTAFIRHLLPSVFYSTPFGAFASMHHRFLEVLVILAVGPRSSPLPPRRDELFHDKAVCKDRPRKSARTIQILAASRRQHLVALDIRVSQRIDVDSPSP